MVQSARIKTVLHEINLAACDQNGSVSSYDERYFVISKNDKLRWIVPANPLLGKKVLAQWHPYGLVSQVAWFVLRCLYSLRCASLMPGVTGVTANVVRGVIVAGSKKVVSPVIYVGTRGSQQKAVVTFVDLNTGQPLVIMKVALESGARISLKREAETLKSLAQLGVRNVPKLLTIDNENGPTWQTVISGRLTSRKLTRSHIDFLLKLPRHTTTTLDHQKDILCGLIESSGGGSFVELPGVIKKAINQIKGKKNIPLVLVHGDFAPWNLKRQPNNQLAAIDWEDSEFDGLPLWDLCHFHYIQAYLFGDNKRVRSFLSGRLIKEYLQKLEIEKVDHAALVLLYLLGMVFQKNGNKNREFKDFLIEQVPLVLAN
ncbi:MAG: aminoglycoside phosphotransferase family protein [Porticoccaceae bacterium]|nr:aminoglycoside phosphotransferase family protein [Porticoccaceae bacterium]